jgi:hypothetical protein
MVEATLTYLPIYSLSSGSSCSGFRSPYSCGCGQPSFAHQTLVETKAEREARGCPVGRDVPYAAMGGLTGFSSLADGYLRLDDSGAGETSRLHHRLITDSLTRDSHKMNYSKGIPVILMSLISAFRYEI